MAKRTKSNKQTRDSSRIANRSRLRSATLTNKILGSNNRLIEDRRRFSPLPYSSKKTNSSDAVTITRVRTIDGPTRTRRTVKGFVAPNQVITCVRRKTRREVLHALNKSGKSGQRRPRRNPNSNIHC